jgi:CHAD domain-containing protein
VSKQGGHRGAVQGLEPGTPFHDAAAIALRQRLKAVSFAIKRLDPVSSDARVRPEQIHQLRVSVRRAGAAVIAFEPAMDAKAVKRLKKSLKVVRRAVGEARQCDVNRDLLSHEFHANHGPQRDAVSALLREIRSRRRAAIRRLDRALAQESASRVRRRRRRAIESIAPVRDESGQPVRLDAAARQTIATLVAELRRFGQESGQSAEAMHELRLAGKRLRYAAEVFECCFDAERLRQVQHEMVELQDRLGVANDLHEIVAFIEDASRLAADRPLRAREGRRVGPDDLAPVLEVFREREAQAIRAFERWWRAGGVDELASGFDALIGAAPSADEDAGGAPVAPASRFPAPEVVLGGPVILRPHRQSQGSTTPCT